MTGRVRDFQAANVMPGGHPDFETFSGADASEGIVQDTLGADRKPVLADPTDEDDLVLSAESFNEWYHNVEGVNLPYVVDLWLEPTGGTFVFDVNHPRIYPKVWGAIDPYESSGSDHRLAIHTRWSAAMRRGEARVEGWAMTSRGVVEIRERRLQRAWTEAELTSVLERAGFVLRDVIPFDPFAEGSAIPVKLVFVARRA